MNDNVQFCELIFCSSDGDYSLSDAECDVVDMSISIRDDEATLTVVEDPYLSVSDIVLGIVFILLWNMCQKLLLPWR